MPEGPACCYLDLGVFMVFVIFSLFVGRVVGWCWVVVASLGPLSRVFNTRLTCSNWAFFPFILGACIMVMR